MPRDFFPRPEGEILAWSSNFRDQIVAAPGDFSLSEAQAQQYSEKHDAFAAAYRAASEPATRTRSNVFAKSGARVALEAEARQLARIVRAAPNVTAQQRYDLGLSAPRTGGGTRIGAPASAPSAHVVSVSGRTVRLRLRDADAPDNRGKPRGVASAAILTFAGDEPPLLRSGWTLNRHATRTTVDVTFGADVAPGTKVYVAACWLNPRGQAGPLSTPQIAYLGYAGPSLGILARAA